MNTDFCGFLVTHGIAAGGCLLCIYKRQRESWDKGLLGQVFADDWGMYSPLDSIQLTRSGHEILVGLIKRLGGVGLHASRLNVGFSPKRS
jgi:hypothetical protein